MPCPYFQQFADLFKQSAPLIDGAGVSILAPEFCLLTT